MRIENEMPIGAVSEPQFSVKGALASLSLSMLLSALGTSKVNIALPILTQTFNASFQQIQWIVIAYLLAVTALIVSAGRLGDMTGRRRLLLGGLFIYTASSLFCGFAPSLQLLIVGRAIQGLGGTVMMALTLAFVGETVPKEKTGSAMGLLSTMSAVGTALGPSLGGFLISSFGWRSIFLFNIPLGVLAFLLSYRYLPVDRRKPDTQRVGFDNVGTVLLALALTAYALAMTIGRGNYSGFNLALLLAAVLGVALFIYAETKAASPLIRLAVFRNPILSVGFTTSALVSTVLMATLVVGPFYLTEALGLETALVGMVICVGPVVVALAGVPAGRLTDKFGNQHITIIGLCGIAAGSFLLSLIPVSFGVPGYLFPIVIITFGYALFQTANNTAVMANIEYEQRGVVSGILSLSRNLGLITGASVMGAVFAFASGSSNITSAPPEAVAEGMRITFAVAGILILFALIIVAIGHFFSKRTFQPIPEHDSE